MAARTLLQGGGGGGGGLFEPLFQTSPPFQGLKRRPCLSQGRCISEASSWATTHCSSGNVICIGPGNHLVRSQVGSVRPMVATSSG